MEEFTVSYITEAERDFLAFIIGYELRHSRTNAGLSQGDLALGVASQSTVSLVESGRQLPMPDVLLAFAEKLDCPSVRHYATVLESKTLSVHDILSDNKDILLEALLAHRGKWQEIHEKIALQLCQYYYYAKDYQKSQEICQLIINHRKTGPAFSQACFYLGSCKLQGNDMEVADEWLRSSELASDGLDSSLKGKLYYNLGYVNTQLDIQVLAMWYAHQAEHEFSKTNDFERRGKSLALLGVIQNRLGKHLEAKSSLEIAHEIMTKWGNSRLDQGRIEVSLADTNVCLNNLEEARHWCARALESATESADLLCMAGVNRELSLIFLKEGDSEKSRKTLAESVRYAEIVNDTWSMAKSYLLAVSIYVTYHEKLSAAQRVYDITLNTNNHVLHALSAEALASLYTEVHQTELAEDYRSRALKAYRKYIYKNSMFSKLSHTIPGCGHL